MIDRPGLYANDLLVFQVSGCVSMIDSLCTFYDVIFKDLTIRGCRFSNVRSDLLLVSHLDSCLNPCLCLSGLPAIQVFVSAERCDDGDDGDDCGDCSVWTRCQGDD